MSAIEARTAAADDARLESAAPPAVRSAAAYAIRTENIGVQYQLRFNKKKTIRQSLAEVLSRQPVQRFWALHHVSVQLVHGESLAVIGPNGAGKSTFLQVLAGIIRPSEGIVDVRGQISGLLTLGAGFDQELTGRENILLAGAFLGLDEDLVSDLLPAIIEYADLGDFIDAPIKVYSSGMRARLGFSIATSVDPDILLLDEVLATGDATFREKSKARVIELVKAAKAVVLVTHDMAWVTEYCNRAILIEKGEVVVEGEPEEVVEVHREHTAAEKERKEAEAVAARLDPKLAPVRR
ncbi:MAG TPA: ABC transporter ATP-binding protein [Candidatus Limnocylindrales bacterium]|nr:ABC transporter ATP-binding protein [Candidatus Limnocylindrales bacterium]